MTGISHESALSSVVFPEPVPPATAIEREHRTAQERSRAYHAGSEPSSTRRSRVLMRSENFLIERGEDAVHDDHDLLGRVEDRVRRAQLPVPLEEEGGGPVDHDLGDLVVLEEGLYRAEAADLVDGLPQERLAVDPDRRDRIMRVQDGLEDHEKLGAGALRVGPGDHGGYRPEPHALDELSLQLLPGPPELGVRRTGRDAGPARLDRPDQLED